MDNQTRLKCYFIIIIIASLVLGGVTGGVVGYYVTQIAKIKSGTPTAGVTTPGETKTVYVETQTEAAVQRTLPAVVSIIITKTVSTDIFVSPFFGLGDGQGETEKREVGGGSGFIVSADGLIVTNRHVVEDASAEYTVVLADDRRFPAKVLARDTIIDLAIIKIEAKDLPTLNLGDSDAIKLGQTVIAIGNALGEFQSSVTVGVISGINRRIIAGGMLSGNEMIEEAIQTDAAINPGNSGGPLLNLEGEVIGVNTAVSEQGQSVGFAIPINLAKQSIESVKKFGRIVRPYIGIRYTIITPELAAQEKLPFDYGALVVRGSGLNQPAVISGSPADVAGIVEEDIILEVDGEKVTEEHSLAGMVVKHKVGDTLKFKVYHRGKTSTLSLTLVEIPDTTK